MRKLPFEHRIKKPHKYISAIETDIRKTIKAAQKVLEEAEEIVPTNVKLLRKKAA